ncbi:MAG: phage terminase large subunit [Bacteroidetes bacterium]|nr:phage terminase large subunit [Bacteroidota bacterium]
MFDLSGIDFDRMPAEEQEELLRLVRAEEFYSQRGSLTLHEFVKQFWHVLEPTTPFIDNWHIGAICEHLEACYRREIRKLIINVPPRSLKSMLTSVFFPAWVWTKDPSHNFLTASFAKSLALRDATKARDLIRSPEYRAYFGDLYQIASDQDTKEYYKTDQHGSRRSLGVGSSVVGEGGDINICDDPNNPEREETAADRIAANFWYKNKWFSRYNDPKTHVHILMQQRVHVMDVSGYVIDLDLGFEILKIPFRYEGEKNVTSIGFSDPREVIGELVSTERFSEEDAKSLEKALGSQAAAQLQQRPVSNEGDMFPASKAESVSADAVPNELTLVRYWDKAFTEGGGAYTAGVLMGIAKNMDLYVLDVVRGQWGAAQRDANILQTANRDAKRFGGIAQTTTAVDGTVTQTGVYLGGKVKIWLEQEPGSMGRDSVDLLIRSLRGYSVDAERPTGDKVTRAGPFSSQWMAGNVKIVEGEWNTDYINEMGSFPKGKYKDQVDASSGAFNKLATKRRVRVL